MTEANQLLETAVSEMNVLFITVALATIYTLLND